MIGLKHNMLIKPVMTDDGWPIGIPIRFDLSQYYLDAAYLSDCLPLTDLIEDIFGF